LSTAQDTQRFDDDDRLGVPASIVEHVDGTLRSKKGVAARTDWDGVSAATALSTAAHTA
jgi:hypothetical protein